MLRNLCARRGAKRGNCVRRFDVPLPRSLRACIQGLEGRLLLDGIGLAPLMADLGDAPDSTNTFDARMPMDPRGAPSPQANYPTVFRKDGSPFGPMHRDPKGFAFLGERFTLEEQADTGADEDPSNNIIPKESISDQDGADDGIRLTTLTHAEANSFRYDVNVVELLRLPLYANVWFDWNRDGDWDDTMKGPSGEVIPEWAVQNQRVVVKDTGVNPQTTPDFLAWHPKGLASEEPLWMRITLAEQEWQPSVLPVVGYGGSGPVEGYAFGETEDYWITKYRQTASDYGDAPAPYPTLRTDDGARHGTGGLFLGASHDNESDGQPDASALGDDTHGIADEDGIVWTFGPAEGFWGMVDVTASAPGKLDAWLDWGADGSWSQPEDRIFTSQPVVAGVNHLQFPGTWPGISQPRATFARFRLSSAGGLSYTGAAPDGEVEDYKVYITGLDNGDAPDPYPTNGADRACHMVVPGFYLGRGVDLEFVGTPSAGADADDLNPVGAADDEDGVLFKTPVVRGGKAVVEVTASMPGRLDAFIDFGGNGTWADPGDRIFASTPLVAGPNTLTFSVPATARPGATYARFRLSREGGLNHDLMAGNGEVEDYRVTIGQGLPPDSFEPNDRVLDAIDLGFLGQTRNNLSLDRAGDEDWFKWNALDSGPVTAELSFDPKAGQLQAEVFDSQGKLIGRGDPQGGVLRINFDSAAGGSYFVHVYAPDQSIQPVYTLKYILGTASKNYAVLFAGGSSPGSNYSRYYNNIKDLYLTLTGTFHLSQDRIYVVYADGTNSGADQSTSGGLINSDMSFATHVLSATGANLQNLLTNTLAPLIDSNDHFLFWSFDHGGGTFNASGTTGEETLTGWYDSISDEDLDTWLGSINAGYETYVFTQCFAGGMLDNLMPLSGVHEHGSAATNHYEYSWGDGFAAAYIDGLPSNPYSHDAYWYAYTHDPFATNGQGPGGTVIDHVEHPWETGTNHRIFSTNESWLPLIREFYPIRFPWPPVDPYLIPFDALAARAGLTGPQEGLRFRIESVDMGLLELNGKEVSPGRSIVGPGDVLRWLPPREMEPGLYDPFTVRASNGDTVSDLRVPVPISFVPAGQPVENQIAFDDLADVSENDVDVVIPVLANDKGASPLSVVGVGSAQHGIVQLVKGVVYYTPAWNADGTDSFTYSMRDSSGNVDSATVNIRIRAVNDPPVAYPDEADIAANSPGEIVDVLMNDFDEESKPFTWDLAWGPYPIQAVVTSPPSSGVLTPTGDGRFTYKPNAGFTGIDRFTYRASDGDLLSPPVIVTLRVALMDWGDAPASALVPGYPTRAMENGARHVIAGPWLGDPNDKPDAEPDGQPNASATGDDLNTIDDEDGVRVATLVLGTMGTARVTVSGGIAGAGPGGVVDAWIDFNGNRKWEPAEQIYSALLPAGVHTISFPVPAGAVLGATFARFRISTQGGLPPVGAARDGEVEDHIVRIIRPITLDYFEPNDSIERALDIGLLGQTRQGLTLDHSGDEDWLRWKSLNGGRTAFQATFDGNAGDVNVEVYSNDGKLLARSEAKEGLAEVVFDTTPDTQYYIRTYGRDDLVLIPHYDLVIHPTFIVDNYAVLFAGGSNSSNNHFRYYNNIKNLHDTLVDLGVPESHIYVLFADGTNPAVDRSDGQNSDMSFATNVMSATPANLQTVLTTTIPPLTDSNDHFFFWSFDHGGGTHPDPGYGGYDPNAANITGEETLIGWGSSISDENLADWLGHVDAGSNTYVFTQCFAGGMLDNLMPVGADQYGASATNHYEFSYGDYFAAAFTTGMTLHNNTHDVFNYAATHDAAAATLGTYVANGGTYVSGTEHPWETGSNFPIIGHTQWPRLPILAVPWYLRLPPEEKYLITFDRLRASARGLEDAGVMSYRIESVEEGALTMNGKPVVPGRTLVGPGDVLLWTPPLGLQPLAPEPVSTFTIRAYDGVTISNERHPVQILLAEPLLAFDDQVSIGENDANVVIPVLKNDKGTGPLSVISVGEATYGTVELVRGQVLYTPFAMGNATDTFTYYMQDADGNVDSATVTVSIAAENDAPIAVDDYFVVPASSAGNRMDILANDFDEESKSVFFIQTGATYALQTTITGGPAHGTLTPVRNGIYAYTPVPGFIGEDSFTYVASDGQSQSNPATVRISVRPDAAPAPIEATSGDDTITIRLDKSAAFIEVFVNIPPGPAPTAKFPRTVPSLTLQGLQGSDTFVVDFTNGSPIPDDGLNLEGDQGNDSVILTNTRDFDGITVEPSRIQWEDTRIDAPPHPVPINLMDMQSIALDSATPTIPLGYLSMGDGSVAKVLPGSRTVLTGGIMFGRNARLDLMDNDAVVVNGDLAGLIGLLRSARNASPRWSGPGIGTSSANADQGLAIARIGTDVKIKFTWNGDLNLDGRVNADDYFYIDQGFLQRPKPPTYHDGDFNFDGKIDADDYFLIDQAFLNQKGLVLSAPRAALAAVVKGPAKTKLRAVETLFSRNRVRKQIRRLRG